MTSVPGQKRRGRVSDQSKSSTTSHAKKKAKQQPKKKESAPKIKVKTKTKPARLPPSIDGGHLVTPSGDYIAVVPRAVAAWRNRTLHFGTLVTSDVVLASTTSPLFEHHSGVELRTIPPASPNGRPKRALMFIVHNLGCRATIRRGTREWSATKNDRQQIPLTSSVPLEITLTADNSPTSFTLYFLPTMPAARLVQGEGEVMARWRVPLYPQRAWALAHELPQPPAETVVSVTPPQRVHRRQAANIWNQSPAVVEFDFLVTTAQAQDSGVPASSLFSTILDRRTLRRENYYRGDTQYFPVLVTTAALSGARPVQEALDDDSIREISTFNRLSGEALSAAKFMTFGIPGKAFHVPAPTTTMVYLTGGPLNEAHLLFLSLDGIRRGRSGQAAVGAVRFMYALGIHGHPPELVGAGVDLWYAAAAHRTYGSATIEGFTAAFTDLLTKWLDPSKTGAELLEFLEHFEDTAWWKLVVQLRTLLSSQPPPAEDPSAPSEGATPQAAAVPPTDPVNAAGSAHLPSPPTVAGSTPAASDSHSDNQHDQPVPPAPTTATNPLPSDGPAVSEFDTAIEAGIVAASNAGPSATPDALAPEVNEELEEGEIPDDGGAGGGSG